MLARDVIFGMLRIQRTQTTVVSSVSGMILSGVWDTRIALLALAIFLFHSSAGVLNDIADYEIDRINAPDRPIVKGAISISQAKVLAAVLILLALSTTWLLDRWFFLLAAAVGIPIEILYNYFLKLKNSALGSFLYLSSSVSPVPFLVGCIVSRNLTTNTVALALALLLLSSCIALGSFKDVEGDERMGKRTFVVTLGVERAKRVMAIVLLISIAAYLAPVILFSFSATFLALAVPLSVVRGSLGYTILRDPSPPRARYMVMIARLLIVSDYLALILTRPLNGV